MKLVTWKCSPKSNRSRFPMHVRRKTKRREPRNPAVIVPIWLWPFQLKIKCKDMSLSWKLSCSKRICWRTKQKTRFNINMSRTWKPERAWASASRSWWEWKELTTPHKTPQLQVPYLDILRQSSFLLKAFKDGTQKATKATVRTLTRLLISRSQNRQSIKTGMH